MRTLLIFLNSLICLTACSKGTYLKQETFMGLYIGQSIAELQTQIDSLLTIGNLQSLFIETPHRMLGRIPFATLTTGANNEIIEYYALLLPNPKENAEDIAYGLNLYIKSETNAIEKRGKYYYYTLYGEDNAFNYIDGYEGRLFGSDKLFTSIKNDLYKKYTHKYGKPKIYSRNDSIQVESMLYTREDKTTTNMFPIRIENAMFGNNKKEDLLIYINTYWVTGGYYKIEITYRPNYRFEESHKKEYEELQKNLSIF